MSLDTNLKLNITISCDDCNPKSGYRILGEQTEKWFRELNERYGCKFTLFCPSNWHNEYPVSKHKGWANELNSLDFCEIAYHGHLHMTSNPRQFGECEFAPEMDVMQISQRLHSMAWEWAECGIYPVGFRTPGWAMSDRSKSSINNFWYDGREIEYVAVHYEHNRGMKWNCKTFFGHDGIQQENISIHNTTDDGEGNQTGMIMFQSHIAGKHNHNVWNQNNFDQLCLSLDHLVENYSVEFKTLKECT